MTGKTGLAQLSQSRRADPPRVPGNPLWQGRIRRYSPMTAGLAIQTTTAQTSQPHRTELGLLAAYASAAVVVGAILFHRRDA